MSERWYDVGAVSDVAEGAPFAVKVEGRRIAIYLLAGRYCAIDGLCPHADGLLSRGRIAGEEIECPLHGARFHIPTGRHLGGPGRGDLECYPVKQDGERLLVCRND